MEIALLANIFLLLIFLIILNKVSQMTITNAAKISEVTRLGKRKLLGKWGFMEACACLS